jgi:hypothetical protein
MDPDPSINRQKMKENLDFYCFVTSYDFLSMKNDVNAPSKGISIETSEKT